ncbi:hypothetical protein A4X06_0g9958 [Tilletia controversa]|uniref:Uncharacterized protein n=1 Tax=Tilletia controversa TaxID=13291 RepID=A0A8X7MHR4_9BASI|nr:hypothetical protein A4X06_0g9958 [Tilletia controversa]
MVKFHSYQNRCVNRRSHQFKWVGLFAIALIGLCSMEDLWEKFGGFRMRVLTDEQSLQAGLKGNEFAKKNPVEAAYGSKVTFKNMGQGGGLLHSHV